MILRKVKITNFKSINGEQEIEINDSVTTLIGLNESGKTSILDAISKLDGTSIKSEEINVNNDDKLVSVIGRFEFEDKEIERINNHNVIVRIPEEARYCVISVEYNNKNKDDDGIYYSIEDANCNEIDINSIISKNLNLLFNDFFEKNGIVLPDEVNSLLSDRSQPNWSTLMKNSMAKYMEKEGCGEVLEYVSEIEKEDWKELIQEFKIVKFTRSDIIENEVKLPNTEEEIAGNIQLSNILNIIGVTAKDFIEITSKKKLDKIAQIEKKIFDKMTNKFKMIFRQVDENFNFNVRISEDKISFYTYDRTSNNETEELKSSIPLEQRSDGFKWYFSIYLTLYEYLKNKDDKKYILLFDEPNLYLNPKAQIDLVKEVFKKEFESEQIIFTTHSPYMIDVENMENVRIIVKENETKIYNTPNEYSYGCMKDKVFPDVMAPIRSALQIDVSSYIMADCSKIAVIVEGLKDRYVLMGMINQIEYGSKTNDYFFVPSTGATKVWLLYNYLVGIGYKCILVFDNDKEGREAIEKLKKDADKKSALFDNIITYNVINSSEKDFCLENMFLKEDIELIKLDHHNIITYRDFYKNAEKETINLSETCKSNFSKLFDKIIEISKKDIF